MKRALHVGLNASLRAARAVARRVGSALTAGVARRVGSALTAGVARRVGSALAAGVARALPNACALCGTTSHRALCAGCATCLDDTMSRCSQCALPLGASVGAPVNASMGACVADASACDYAADTPVCERSSDLPCGSVLCGQCIARAPAFDATLCVSDYVAPADALVIALKFRAHLELADAVASVLAARAATSRVPLPDLVVPIPLSTARLASRGYNQAWEIARVFARRIGRPADAHCLGRARDTRAQSSLRGTERWRNMRRAFVVSRPDRVRGAHIGLVDDVMTSGATLEAAASVLKRAGATRVTVFVVLRTPTPTP